MLQIRKNNNSRKKPFLILSLITFILAFSFIIRPVQCGIWKSLEYETIIQGELLQGDVDYYNFTIKREYVNENILIAVDWNNLSKDAAPGLYCSSAPYPSDKNHFRKIFNQTFVNDKGTRHFLLPLYSFEIQEFLGNEASKTIYFSLTLEAKFISKKLNSYNIHVTELETVDITAYKNPLPKVRYLYPNVRQYFIFNFTGTAETEATDLVEGSWVILNQIDQESLKTFRLRISAGFNEKGEELEDEFQKAKNHYFLFPRPDMNTTSYKSENDEDDEDEKPSFDLPKKSSVLKIFAELIIPPPEVSGIQEIKRLWLPKFQIFARNGFYCKKGCFNGICDFSKGICRCSEGWYGESCLEEGCFPGTECELPNGIGKRTCQSAKDSRCIIQSCTDDTFFRIDIDSNSCVRYVSLEIFGIVCVIVIIFMIALSFFILTIFCARTHFCSLCKHVTKPRKYGHRIK